ncbi:MAG: hypothetical protein JO002_00630 [Burkholderiaceae bacterium]|nr:hypothetical protein [Burkholderiaceae bacterium]
MNMFWPSFLVAILAEGAFFSLFDPTLLPLPHLGFDLTPLAVYTLGFLFFWTCGTLSSLLTCYLQWVPDNLLKEIDRKSGAGL